MFVEVSPNLGSFSISLLSLSLSSWYATFDISEVPGGPAGPPTPGVPSLPSLPSLPWESRKLLTDISCSSGQLKQEEANSHSDNGESHCWSVAGKYSSASAVAIYRVGWECVGWPREGVDLQYSMQHWNQNCVHDYII